MKERGFNLQRMKLERLSRNVTTKEVASALGISVNSYYLKERGATNITAEEIPIILDTLGIKRSDAGMFYDDKEEEAK